MKRLAALGLAATAFSFGCSEPSERGQFQLRDSSGVTVAESVSSAWTTESRWRLSQELLLDIGGESGNDAYQFDRIAGVIHHDDMSVVVADGSSSEIKSFDPNGNLQWRLGRPGDGPGEFRMINRVGRAGSDSLWVYDFSLRRFTFIDESGSLAGVVTLQSDIPTLGAVGRLSDGSLLLAQYWASGISRGNTFGLHRDRVAYVRFSERGFLIDTIGLFPGREIFLASEDGRRTMGSPPFGKVSTNTMRGDTVYIGDQARFEIGMYTADGTPVRSIRKKEPPLPVSEQDLNQWIERSLAAVPDSRRPGVRRNLTEMDVPETRPAYRDLLTDEQGNLWVSDYAQSPQTPAHWSVFDRDGRLLGTVAMPAGFQPYDILGATLAGVWRDEFEVEHVRIYRLSKP